MMISSCGYAGRHEPHETSLFLGGLRINDLGQARLRGLQFRHAAMVLLSVLWKLIQSNFGMDGV
jgi:hypothetical protein